MAKSKKQIRRQRTNKREANAAKRLPNQIAAQNQARKDDNKAATEFNASFTIDGKDFSYRDPGISNSYSTSRKPDNRYGDFDGGNSNAYEYTNPLYQYSQGRVSDAARALGIGNVNSKKEVNQILGQIRNPQSSVLPQINTPNNNNNNNNNSNNKNKNKNKNNQQDPAQAPAANPPVVGPEPDNRLQVLQDNFQNQIDALMGSIAGYEQKFLDQQADYDKRLLDMRNTLSAQMNPQMRNPIFGVRSQAMGGGGRNIRNSFGRAGRRLNGIRNTTLNVS
ncbi:hypothetical protein OAE68_01025 [Synechococcus sp. AH-551-A10]|nr:hypothetical protein [Synechococcus sp. AH-551-A10]MDB4682241.1 hypothetical protein [Synechococcus sp. AH-551-A10]